MKRILLLLFLSFFYTSAAHGQSLELERILNYDVTITVDSNAGLLVTEKLKVNVLGERIERGIFRTLPTQRKINNKSISVKYDILNITKNGVEEKYRTERENGNFVIYIGRKNVLLDPGIYDYEITYKTYRQIGFFDDFDELYWNVTGNDWIFPIDKVTTKIILPGSAKIIQNVCYTGSLGSTEQNCKINSATSNTLSFSAENLNPYQGLTIATGFDKGIVNEPKLPAILKTGNLSKVLIVLSTLLIALMGYLWNRYGRDHESPTVYPQFEVPENISPASMGFLHSGKYSQNMITVSLINLAVKGFISINETKKKGLFSKQKFELQKLKPADQSLPPEEQTLLKELFVSGNDTISIDGKYCKQIEKANKSYQIGLSSENQPKLNKGSNWTKVLWVFLAISLIYWSIILYTHYNVYEPQKLAFGSILYVGAIVTLLIILGVRLSVAKYIWIIPLISSGGVLLVWYFTSDGKPDAYALAFLFLVVGVILLAFFNYFIKKPSEELLAQQSKISGFKMYLETAESELIKFYNPPQITPEVFEKYLPYALVLGVDGIWGKKFEQSLKANSYTYENRWYNGTTTVFSSNMTSSLSKSLTSNVNSSSTAPSSSGSGGGGSSGGGGGGGGGGGW
jgi:uncharacterized membrane protein